MVKRIETIAREFQISGKILSIVPITNGNINHTYIVTYETEPEVTFRYILQKINSSVFTEPLKLMKNVEKVTAFFTKKLESLGDSHQALALIPTLDGNYVYTIKNDHGEKEYFRMYNYIPNAISYDRSTDSTVVFNTGKAFGHFQKLLNDYPIDDLEYTIPDFHNTVKRYQNFMRDVKINACGRAMSVSSEILFVIMNEDEYSRITSELGHSIPLRVTHNDTKVNNVMMDKNTGDFLTVIDLDTVMPGSALYDYGDGIRSAASTAFEDETDLSTVHLNMELFEAYTSGFMSQMAPYLTPAEVSLLGRSIKIITLELGMRFLNDYINGDTYFKIDSARPQHNLDRARNQFTLAQDIEKKMPAITQYIATCYNKYLR